VSFVISRGGLSSLEAPIGDGYGTYPARGIAFNATLTYTYGRLFRAQPQVRTVVDFLARNVAQLNLHTFQRVGDNDRKRLTEHPLAKLLGKPNPSTTPYRLMYAMVADRAIYDVAFWLKVRDDGGQLTGLRRVSPHRVTPVDGDWLEVDTFRITGSRGHRDVPRADWVVFPGYDPEEESSTGTSAIESLRLILAEEHAASRYREQLWRNGARAAGYITRPADAPEWSPTAKDRFRETWQAQYAGDGPMAGGTPILEDDMKWVTAGITPKDAQYVESRALTREECAAAYHIPPPMVGLLDNATFSNVTEQHKQLYADTLGPWTESGQQEIELQLVPEFQPQRGIYVEFNWAAKVAGSVEEQAAALQTAVGRPWMTPNEARGRVNLPQLDGDADELLAPMNMGNAGGDPAAETEELDPDSGAQADADVDADADPVKSMTDLARAARKRARRRLGKHLPGEHDQSTHGNDAGGSDDGAMTWAAVQDLYTDEIDSAQTDNFAVGVFENGDFTLFYRPTPDTFEPMIELTPDTAAALASALEWASDNAPEDGDGDETYLDNLPIDDDNDVWVGFTGDGSVRITVSNHGGIEDPEADPDADQFLVSPDEAIELRDALERMTEAAEENEKAGRPRRKRIVRAQVRPRARKARADPGAVDEHAAALTAFFQRQERSVVSRAGAKARKADPVTVGDVFDVARWNRELSRDLGALSPAVVEQAAVAALDAAGAQVDAFDPALVVNFLAADAQLAAEKINAVTEAQVEAALDAPDIPVALAAVFAAAIAVRVAQLAAARVTGLSGFGTVEAARQLAGAEPDREITKTWITGENPRASHAAMDGQTVPYDAPFSNGGMWPADAVNLDVDDIAGCNCDVEIRFGE
jgi:HK97 family phage portal protein